MTKCVGITRAARLGESLRELLVALEVRARRKRQRIMRIGKHTFLPCTFAAPTFGNQQFADLFDKTFPNSYRAVNTLDIVPMAFENLDGIQKAYSPTGETISESGLGFDTIVQTAKDSIGNVYRSPKGGTVLSYTGWMPTTVAKWADIVAANHASQLYLDEVQTAAAKAINKT